MLKKLNYKVLIIHSLYWFYECFIWVCYPSDIPFTILNFGLFIPIVYLHYFILIPRIINVPTVKAFLIWYLVFFGISILRKEITLFIALEYFVAFGWLDWKAKYELFISMGNTIISSLSNSVCILVISLGSRHVINLDKSKELEKRKVKNELRTLKNQIDISETINILSKLEIKGKSKPDSIQEQIIQLSSVLRYHLYSKEGEIALSKELEVVINQLRLYNKLNNSELKLFNRVDERNIKTGVLSKVIGEVLKHTKKVTSKLELVEFSGNTCLKVSDSNPDVLKEVKEHFKNNFLNQLNIQTTSKSILIQLN